MNKLYLVLVVALLVGCQQKTQLPSFTSLDTNWSFRSLNSNDWYPATVPGNIYSDLIDNKLIEDPFIGANETKVQWVADSTWVYQTHFDVSSSTLNKDHLQLHFGGLDTYAKVYLNDSLILSSNNAFRNYKIPVKKLISSRNTLAVHFAPTHYAEEIEKNKLDYTLPEGNRVFTRKAQFQYGWDWGPKLNTMGIWKEVSLQAWDDSRIENVYLRKDSYTEKEARFTAIITLTSSPEKSTSIQVFADGQDFSLQIPTGKQTNQFEIPITIEDPIFWWPHNLGIPHLYEVEVQLVQDGIVRDVVIVNHGVRNVSLIAEEDEHGQSFYFNINGIPVYMKGANYIPQHSLQNRVTDAHYENLLQDVVDANMNMLRVWGGGIYENDVFYDLCDKKGILVWQDFMYACAMYPGDEAFLENAKQEAEDQLVRLRNHPSIVLWCGNNENNEGWHNWGWQDGKTQAQKDKIWGDYLKLFDSILPAEVAKHTQLDYWESSPKYGRGNPKYQFEGDAHDWWVWHDGYPFEHFEDFVPRFMSEFGFQSFPSMDAMKFINHSKEIQIDTDGMKSHQKHHRGYELIDLYMERDYKVPENDEDYVYVSQLVQARGMRMGIEAHRRAKPYNMGTLYWQLNDCWPGISWSSIDHFGNWKALHYEAKEAFENILISFKREGNHVNVYIVNDLLKNLEETLVLQLYDFKGNVLWSSSLEVEVDRNSSVLAQSFFVENMSGLDGNEVLLDAKYGNYTNTYFFEKPKNLALDKAEIHYEIQKVEQGFSVDVTSPVFQKNVMLMVSAKGHFSDNYFDLKPNETKTVLFKTKASSIEELTYKSLNQLQTE
ncbi:MAG: beta-mannosidase [Flavobacteriaceae bacterium]